MARLPSALPALLLVMLSTVACRSSYIAIPDALAPGAADAYAVEGRISIEFEEVITFGTYTAGAVTRSGIDHTASDTRQSFGFPLSESTVPDESWSCLCDTYSERTEVDVVQTTLTCAFVSADSDVAHALKITATNDDPLSGTLEHLDDDGTPAYTLMLEGTREISSEGQVETLQDTAGFYIKTPGGETLAAVDVTHKGFVWIARSLDGPQRTAVAATAASLLLHRDLRNNL